MWAMQWLNYNHLYYFWAVACEGSIRKAAEELMVSQPTISSQVRELEKTIGRPLFMRGGRGMVLTETGQMVFNYAHRIFTVGQELINALENQPAMPLRLSVGVLDVIPKTVVRRLLDPVITFSTPVRLICREDKADRLLTDLAARRYDVVLSDSPIGDSVQVQGYNHLLGESSVTFLGVGKKFKKLRRNFPRNLDDVPFLLPTDSTALRRSLNIWFNRCRIHPQVIAEFDDGAAMASFGRSGIGIFPVPTIVEEEIRLEHNLMVIGKVEQVKERFYAIALDEKPTHPVTAALCFARKDLRA